MLAPTGRLANENDESRCHTVLTALVSESTTDVNRSEPLSIIEDDFASSESVLQDMVRAHNCKSACDV